MKLVKCLMSEASLYNWLYTEVVMQSSTLHPYLPVSGSGQVCGGMELPRPLQVKQLPVAR